MRRIFPKCKGNSLARRGVSPNCAARTGGMEPSALPRFRRSARLQKSAQCVHFPSTAGTVFCMNAQRPPTGLGPRGRALWRDTMSRYTLTPSERELLHALCQTVDQHHRLCQAVAALKSLTTTGSAGQTIPHPLLNEARAHAEQIRRMHRQLGLPDSVSKPPREKKINRPVHRLQVRRLEEEGMA